MKRLFAVTLSVFVLAGLVSLTRAHQESPKLPVPQAPQEMMRQGCLMMPMDQMVQACMRLMPKMSGMMSGGCMGQAPVPPRATR